MKHLIRCLVSMGLLSLLFAAPLTAQNLFEIYPTRPNISTTDYTRLGLGFAAGEILVEVAPKHFCNVGGSASCSCSAVDIDVTLLDLDDSTPDEFRGVIRAPVGMVPVPGGLAVAYTAWQTMTTGTGGPSVETFRLPFLDLLGNQVPVSLPCNGTYYFGIEVKSAACNDGIHVAAARYGSALSGCAAGETCAANAPSLLYFGAPAPAVGVAWPGPKKYSLRMGITTDAPVLNMGNQAAFLSTDCLPWSKGFGVGGLYPNVYSPMLTQESVWARVQDVASPGNAAILFVSVGPATPVCLPYGLLCIQPLISICTIPLDNTGLGICKVLTINANWSPITIQFQAVSLGSGLLTNSENLRL